MFDLALQIEKNNNELPIPDVIISEVDHEVIQELLNRFQPQESELGAAIRIAPTRIIRWTF